MNLSLKRNARSFLLYALLSVLGMMLTPQKAAAQFAVFDAGNLANAVKVWHEDISMNTKMALELAQGAKLFTQTLQIYSLAKQESSFLAKGHILQAVGFAAQHASIPGHPDWDKAMMTTGGLANAASNWQRMMNPGLALKNRLQMANSFAASALKTLGDCNAAATQNQGSLGALESVAMSMGGGANSAASQRNTGNLSAEQQLRYRQCEENLAEQRLKLELLNAHKIQADDQAADDLNTKVDQFNSTGSGEWNSSPESDYRRTGMH